METLRHFKQAQTIHLVAQDLAGTLPLETLSDHLSDLACVILAEVLRLAWEGLQTRHRPSRGSRSSATASSAARSWATPPTSTSSFSTTTTAPEAPETVRTPGAAHQRLAHDA